MQILINNETIDFTLESEKTLGDVFHGIDTWLRSGGLLVTSALRDGNDLPLTGNTHWQSIPVGEIGTLEIQAESASVLYLENLQTFHQYFTLLASTAEEKNWQQLREMFTDVGNLPEALARLLKMKNSDPVIRSFSTVLSESGLLDAGEIREGFEEKLKVLIESIHTILSERIRELLDPERELERTLDMLQQSVPDMSDVSVQLQTGKDKAAMNTVIRFTELSQKLLRLYPRLSESGVFDRENISREGGSLQQFYLDLNGILTELTEAFSANDTVLIGDLLEYEVVPRIGTLKSILSEQVSFEG